MCGGDVLGEHEFGGLCGRGRDAGVSSELWRAWECDWRVWDV